MKLKIVRTGKRSKAKERVQQYQDIIGKQRSRESRIAMIQQLIPIGLMAVERELQMEVEELTGPRYSRGGPLDRWGYNDGSVCLDEQKVSISVPRVRDQIRNIEVPLESYQRLQDGKYLDHRTLAHLVNGISERKYERVAAETPVAFGISKSCVSRKFIRASAKKLQQLMERRLNELDIVVIFMDGKTFAENEIIVALGVTIGGEKIVLGFIESSTENHRVCKEFIGQLEDRGLRLDQEILWVIDGAKGLHKAIKEKHREQAFIQRCQWHKRENVVSYLPKKHQAEFRRKLQAAYEQKTYDKAKAALEKIERELKLINQSAVNSLSEGLEETLTLHRLGVFAELGRSLKTTNGLENLNRQLGIYTDRVSHWKSSDQRQRWVASAILEIEPRLRKIAGHKNLKGLRNAMQQDCATEMAA